MACNIILLNRLNLIWIIIITVYIIISTSVIIRKENSLHDCIDELLISYNLYDLFLTNLILNIIICTTQIIFHFLLPVYQFINNILNFVAINIILGLYINFITNDKEKCLTNINIINLKSYILFLISFIINIITVIFLFCKMITLINL